MYFERVHVKMFLYYIFIISIQCTIFVCGRIKIFEFEFTYSTGWSRKKQTETFFDYKQDVFIKQMTLFAEM